MNQNDENLSSLDEAQRKHPEAIANRKMADTIKIT